MPTFINKIPRRQRWADPTYCPERPRVPTMEREGEAREREAAVKHEEERLRQGRG